MKNNHFEMVILPTDYGDIKVFIYGFQPFGAWGHVVAQYKGSTVTSKGYNRRRTIIRSLSMLHHSLVNEGEV
ncbi:hypothetical protein [Bacillus sp. 2205SS5-2]|uniref:hypothetical protein n=1 Tax=Bacillus sp. 2205SS5-2 TaxID=3109031 RepID=UPI0030055F31